MNIVTKYALLFVLALSVQGCAVRLYNYNGKTYGSAEAALDSQKLYHAEILAGVTKGSPYVGGKLLVFIPDRNAIRATGVRSFKLIGKVKQENTNYIVDLHENGILLNTEIVKKGEFFDSIVVSRELSEIQTERPDYVLATETGDSGLWKLNLYRTDNPVNKISISGDASKKGADWANSFNDSFGKALVSLGANADK